MWLRGIRLCSMWGCGGSIIVLRNAVTGGSIGVCGEVTTRENKVNKKKLFVLWGLTVGTWKTEGLNIVVDCDRS